MKSVKKILLATSLATLLTLSCPDFSKAATQEDINYLIESAKKTESLRRYPEGFEIKALRDEEKIGNLEKNFYFSIYSYPQPDGQELVPKCYIVLDYITHDGDSLDIKQIILRDGYTGWPDGKVDSVSEDRIFEKEIVYTYEENGRSKTEVFREVEDMFTKGYDLEDVKEKERMEKIFDKAVDLFKLKSKGSLTEEENVKYKSLKTEIEDLVMQGEYVSKTKQQLQQEREERLRN